MEEMPLNIALGKEIEKWLALRGRSKSDLARFLGKDQQTMSKLLKGQNLLAMSELEKIFICLSVDESGREVMRRMLSYLILHPRGRSVWDTASLKAMRLRRGLSLPGLSNRTGIMTSRLALLELKNAARPTEEEDMKLRRVFDGTGTYRYESEYVDSLSLKEAIVPVLDLADFRCFRAGMKLESLLRERAVEDTFWMLHQTGTKAVVAANCDELKLAMPGIVILAVADNSDAASHKMELRRSEDGEFFLCERVNKSWKLTVFSRPDAVLKARQWALPVLDMIFKPFDFELEVRKK